MTAVGFLPVGYARSVAGEYAGGIFWVVGIALVASWVVASRVPAVPEPTASDHAPISSSTCSALRSTPRVAC